ncbi:hypothetical protein CHISP_1309 [Chitinispirillum alkaliphilum]|nr:hypothetical protein CHISP_1309 [Chitinispirillum alkaliphilum]
MIIFSSILLLVFQIHATETIMLIDKQRGGIIEVDRNDPRNTASVQQKKRLPPPSLEKPKERERQLIQGREKEPPEAYFNTGLKFFMSGDYHTALEKFSHANTLDPQPHYLLWMGKCYRQVGQTEEKLKIMRTILERYSESDVADDALFEIAFHFQSNNEYYLATRKYRQLAEQYPYGVSFLSEENFLKIAREQIRFMRAELLNILSSLGYSGQRLEEILIQFQNEEHLPETGNPDKITVEKLKERYSVYLRDLENKEKLEQQAMRYIYYIIAIGVVGFLNIIFMIFLRLSLKEKKDHLKVLQHMISDLYEGKNDT